MCRECDWLHTLNLIDDMLLDPDFEWASDTLEGIKKWVEKAEHITDKQKEAIENIYNSVE